MFVREAISAARGRLLKSPLALALSGAVLAVSAGLPAVHAATIASRTAVMANPIGAVSDASIKVSVHLKNRDPAGLAALIQAQGDPTSAQFRQWLTPAQFEARFGPAAATAAAAVDYFRQAGLTVTRRAHILDVSGSPAAIQAAFGVQLHSYEVPAQGKTAALRFHKTDGPVALKSTVVAASIDAVVGLDNEPHYAPGFATLPKVAGRAAPKAKLKPQATATTNPPQYWTVSDVAQYYNVTPLYDAGFHGEGQTIGLIELGAFTPSDVFYYWDSIGLTTDPNRITVVKVNNASGVISDLSLVPVTTDIQQAGGMAPAAAIRVYETPNEDPGLVDAFYTAIHENIAQTLSVSWSVFEWYETAAASSTNTDTIAALNQLFMQAAAQGQSLFAAQGNGGAYQANVRLPVQFYSPTISVAMPGASPYITSVGGTTLPADLDFVFAQVSIPTEQAWGWSYMQPYCDALGMSSVMCGTWGTGGGGGVSAYNPLPAYQAGLAGIAVTQPGQALTNTLTNPPTTTVTLPAGYAGRNVPDISFNADPNTGYLAYYTWEDGEFVGVAGDGGTGFGASQLNGITALMAQRVGGRLGLLNIPLYSLAKLYSGKSGLLMSPVKDITAGDNWFYSAKPGYDQSTGLGTLNVSTFSNELVRLKSK